MFQVQLRDVFHSLIFFNSNLIIIFDQISNKFTIQFLKQFYKETLYILLADLELKVHISFSQYNVKTTVKFTTITCLLKKKIVAYFISVYSQSSPDKHVHLTRELLCFVWKPKRCRETIWFSASVYYMNTISGINIFWTKSNARYRYNERY